jgi:hypothetical protein
MEELDDIVDIAIIVDRCASVSRPGSPLGALDGEVGAQKTRNAWVDLACEPRRERFGRSGGNPMNSRVSVLLHSNNKTGNRVTGNRSLYFAI